MMRTHARPFLLLFAFTAAAQTPHTITPNRGPVAGGTEVRVTGDFGSWPYALIFGNTFVPANRLDDHTLSAVTPAHLPGPVRVTIFEYDFGIDTGQTFTFEGDAEDAFDRLLLPVFTPPIRGAFGSEFRTQLKMSLDRASAARVPVYGLMDPKIYGDSPWELHPDVRGLTVDEGIGSPGRFLYVPKGMTKELVMNLRAYDVSRAGQNFGTQIPIVPASEFATNGYDSRIGLIGVPTSPPFRSTLRIYGTPDWGAALDVEIEVHGLTLTRRVNLVPSGNPYEPSYAEINDLPDGGIVNIWISVYAPRISAMLPAPDLWAFVSVTNNETQHITTITPR